MNKNIFTEVAFDICNYFIKTGNNFVHGREIARKLNANQKTVQNYMGLLEESKILTKTISGKNFLYKITKNPIALSFLEMTESYKAAILLEDFEIRQIMADILNQTRKPILVFGSYAKGYHINESDIDIVLFEKINDIQHKY